MGIRALFTKDQLRSMFDQKQALIEQAIINRLFYIGENFVRIARSNGDYRDITGNLRSSIGFVVVANGKTIKESFKKADRGTDGATGLAKAKSLIEELKNENLSGYVLIVVAGMQYAAAVESRGRDVLSASAIIAKKDLKQAIKELQRNIKSS